MRYAFIVCGGVPDEVVADLPELSLAPYPTGGTVLFGPVPDQSDVMSMWSAGLDLIALAAPAYTSSVFSAMPGTSRVWTMPATTLLNALRRRACHPHRCSSSTTGTVSSVATTRRSATVRRKRATAGGVPGASEPTSRCREYHLDHVVDPTRDWTASRRRPQI